MGLRMVRLMLQKTVTRASFFFIFHVTVFAIAIGIFVYPPQSIEAAAGQQVFTGNGTFTVPTYTRRLTVEVWGAGGAGGGASASINDGNNGTAGLASSFNSGVAANGGGAGGGGTAAGAVGAGGAGGTASGGDVNTSGSAGTNGGSAIAGVSVDGGDGGNPANRGGTGNTGSGVGLGGTPGGGGSGGGCLLALVASRGGGGGGGGGYSRKTYAVGALTPGDPITVVVGTGGLAGGSADCAGGGAGAPGMVRVTWDSVLVTSNSTISSNLHVINSISKGSGSFVIDHPLDPKNKLLYHSFVESPDMKNLYDGTAILDENGEATIRLPDYFSALNRDFRYLALGVDGPMPDLHLKRGVRREWFFGAPTFGIAGGTPGGTISWQVTGIRKDAFALFSPIQVEMEKGPDAPFGKNTCVFEPLCAQ